MSRIANWGRWLVAAYFGLQGLWELSWVAHTILVAVRKQTETFYPAYMALFDFWILLACSWGILKIRHWGYPLAIVVSAFEILIGIAGFIFIWPVASNPGLLLGHMHFAAPFVLIFALAPSLVLAWLSLPAVRAQYLHKELPA